MFTAMILACGMGTNIEGDFAYHCRAITSDIVHESIDQCVVEITQAAVLIELNDWKFIKYDCYDWTNKSTN